MADVVLEKVTSKGIVIILLLKYKKAVCKSKTFT